MKKDPNLSRRNFLKGSIVGAGALTAGFGAGLMTPATAHAALGYLPCDSSHLLDVDLVRKLGWHHFHKSGY